MAPTGEPFTALVHAPLRRDEERLNKALAALHIKSFNYVGEQTSSLTEHIVVCTQEGLTRSFLSWLLRMASNKPEWREVPVVMILDRDVSSDALKIEVGDLLNQAPLTILRRPLSETDFAAAISACVATCRKQAEIAEHLSFQEELRNELNHRLKNTLSTVVALYRMSLKQSIDLTDFDKRFSARLDGLTRVQEMLRTSDDAERTVGAVVRAVLVPYLTHSDRIAVSNVSIPLSRQPALALALMVNELATNAAKYGALSTASGKVLIEGLLTSEDTFQLTWREVGGPPVTPPAKTSYGTRFIQGSAAGLGGAAVFHYEPEGLRCIITMEESQLHPTAGNGRTD